MIGLKHCAARTRCKLAATSAMMAVSEADGSKVQIIAASKVAIRTNRATIRFVGARRDLPVWASQLFVKLGMSLLAVAVINRT